MKRQKKDRIITPSLKMLRAASQRNLEAAFPHPKARSHALASRVKAVILSAALMTLLSPVLAAKPKNPHWHPHKKNARTAQKKNMGQQTTFTGKGWDPRVAAALKDLIAKKGKDSPSYNPQKPPIATLPWEGVFTDGDASDLIFWRLIRRAEFKFSDPFWDIVPIAYGRQKTRAAYEQFSPLPKTIWKTQPTYHQYLKYFLESYQNQCRETGIKACRVYLARLWIGFSEKELEAYATLVLNQEKYQKIQKEMVAEPPEDRSPLFVRRGIRIVSQMQELAKALNHAGFDIWIFSADAQPTLRAALNWAKLPYAHAGGIKIKVNKKGLFDGTVSQPLPFWGGEIETVIFNTGRAPALSIGAWPYDREILRYGPGLKILIDQGDATIRKLALKKHWLIQPAFKR